LQLRPESDQTLEELLTKPKPDIDAQFGYKSEFSSDIQTASAPIEALRARKADFAITSLTNSTNNELNIKQVAYDGLLVFVAFSKKDQNLPKAIGGQLRGCMKSGLRY